MEQLKYLLMAYLLGAFRDASVKKYEGKNYEIVVWQKSIEWLKVLQQIIFLIFEKKTKIFKVKGGFRIRFKSKEVYNFFRKNGLPTSGNHAFWKTPSMIKSSSLRKRFYIAGFFDAEGCVAIYRKGSLEYIRLDFYQSWNNASECPPLQDIKKFLEELDIRCGEVRLRNGFVNYPRFVLSISNLPSIRKFAQSIPLLHPTKKLKLSVVLA